MTLKTAIIWKQPQSQLHEASRPRGSFHTYGFWSGPLYQKQMLGLDENRDQPQRFGMTYSADLRETLD